MLDYLKFPLTQRYVVPQLVWIDKNFNIRSQTTPMGEDNTQYTEGYWRSMIETLLKEPAGGPKRSVTHSGTTTKKAPTS